MSKEKPGLMEKILHPKGEGKSEAMEKDQKVEPAEKPKKKVSAEAGASSERRHQHPKFDKFKKGN